MAPNKCVNFRCPSNPGDKLLHPPEFVCMYYDATFKPYQRVCTLCLEKCIQNTTLMGEQKKNKKCLFENRFSKFRNYIELPESDEEDNVASISNEHPQKSLCKNALETISQNIKIKDLMDVEKNNCQDYLDTEKLSLTAESEQITNSTKTIENELDCIHKELYKYDVKNFKFDEEVTIADNDDVTILNNSNEVRTKGISKGSSKSVSQKRKKNQSLLISKIEFGYTSKNQISIEDSQSHEPENCSVIESINIPSSSPKPFVYKDHQCNHFCMFWVNYNVSQTKNLNTLSIPLHFGFKRHVVMYKDLESNTIKYTTPCGRLISDDNEMYNYLKIVGYGENQMTIDLFNFDLNVNPLALFKVTKHFKYIDDISDGKEFKPISVVNCLNNSIPQPFRYITEREPKSGVNLNLDQQFLCGCDCTDNCDDKSKCACWKLTTESVKNYPKLFENHKIGYHYKRLYEPVHTGIYECNINCKCLKTCSNRLVQKPLSTSLQIFFTGKKGWGVRTLADIPKGTFICTFMGELCTEKDAEKEGEEFGSDYLADLNHIETVEANKNGYESDVDYTSEEESQDMSNSEDENFNPGTTIEKKIKLLESRTSLRQKHIQNTNTKTDGKHGLSKLNTQQSIKTQNNTLRKYMNKDCSAYVMNGRKSGNVGRFFNHSCDPNLFVQNVFIDTHNLEFPWVAYFSATYIPAGTELTMNYGYKVGSVKGQQIKCYCGSKNCKGRLL